ncbi:hypothetical protein [Amycolatopsis sp. PS_44_ISF1]|uniref:hypothetical protein n=1 Tax=Amycolatopsis sp. PS_44_ISF1 TaxID=2974917 RepID=UPI0028DDCC10|nr:hypothetical protein [Amycolatopsis sp. PS_44_ISF1]MDT8912406.1 hypothetical protein [Amycolatopsis sp. PS_44_ISF1]
MREGAPRRRGWLWLLLLAVVAAIVLAIVLTQCSGSNQNNGANGNPPPAPAPAPSAAPDPASGVNAADRPGVAAGQLSADGRALLPLSAVAGTDGSLTGLAGKEVTAHAIPVQSVPAPEGFWVGQNQEDRVWVKLLPQGSSPVDVKKDQLLDLQGTFVKNGDNFAASQKVAPDADAQQLDRQGVHIELPNSQPTVVGTR